MSEQAAETWGYEGPVHDIGRLGVKIVALQTGEPEVEAAASAGWELRQEFAAVQRRVEEHVRAHGGRSSFHQDDPIGDYLDRIGAFPLLTAEEETTLARVIERGESHKAALGDRRPTLTERQALRDGTAASELFVNCNLKLVVSIAKRFAFAEIGIPLPDLVQEGNLGLQHAVEKFDYRRGNKFSTYATWWIRQAIGRAIDNDSTAIRVPVHSRSALRRLRQAQRAFSEADGNAASPEQLASELGWPVDTVVEMLAIRNRVENNVPLEQPVGHDNGGKPLTVGDMLADRHDMVERAVSKLASHEIISRLLPQLKDDERAVIATRFRLETEGDILTHQETADRLGFTLNRTRHLERMAMEKLRKWRDSNHEEAVE